MVGHGGSSAGSYLADPTSPIPSHCASIVMTSTVRVKPNACAWDISIWVVYVVIPPRQTVYSYTGSNMGEGFMHDSTIEHVITSKEHKHHHLHNRTSSCNTQGGNVCSPLRGNTIPVHTLQGIDLHALLTIPCSPVLSTNSHSAHKPMF